MAESRPPARRYQTFQDLQDADGELLRQIAARVHIIDLAYAFGTGDVALRERLLGSVRPGLADQIRSAISTVNRESERYPPAEQIRSARTRVMQVANDTLLDPTG